MKFETGIIKDKDGKDPNKKGKITTAAVCIGVSGALALGFCATKNKKENHINTQIEQEINNEKISFEDTENYELVYITNSVNNETEPYIIEKESSFGIYRYTINDIYTGNTLVVVNRDYTNVDTNSILSIEFKGTLDEYLIAYNNLKQEYNKDEFKTILDKERESIKNNKNKELTKK